MRLPAPLLPATMLSRPNRFALWADLAGKRVYAHVPTSGRMGELLYPGAPVLLRERPQAAGVTTHEVVLAREGRHWVSIRAGLAPGLLAEYLRAHPELLGPAEQIRFEVTCGHSRFDLLVTTPDGEWLIETKSVTLCRHGVGLFPDAPTLRGARHLRELAAHAAGGGRAAAVFVAPRADAQAVAPNVVTDPDFGEALTEAAEAGVRLLALNCRVSQKAIVPHELIPVRLVTASQA